MARWRFWGRRCRLFLLRSEDNEDEEHFCAAKTTKLKGIRLFDSYVIKEVAGIHEVHVHGEDSMKSYLSEKAEKLSFATVQAMAASIVLKPINEAVDPVLKHLFGSITQDVDEVDHEGRRRSSLRGNGGDRGAGAGAGGASAGNGGSGSGSGGSGSGSGLVSGLDFADV